MKKYLIIFLLALGACYYDNEADLYPFQDTNCDTSNVTFSGTIFPLISSKCKACHFGAAPSSGIRLDDYATISAAAAIPEGSSGSLYGAVSHDPGNVAMPQGAAQLPDCTIQQIKAWIDAGRPNN